MQSGSPALVPTREIDMRTPLLPALVLAALAVPSSAQNVLFADDFEAGTAAWTLSPNWHWIDQDDPCAALVGGYPSGTHAVKFGEDNGCHFSSTFFGRMELVNPVPLPLGAGSIDLAFTTNSETENDWTEGWDIRRVQLSTDAGASWTTLPRIHDSPWYRHVVDLTSYAGASILVRFEFDAVDGYGNHFRGWMLDDVAITARAEPGTPFCFGDWCPCDNVGAGGNGCATSFQPAGANLTSSGTASVSGDDVVLTATGLSNSTVTFFQGTGSVFDAPYGSASFGDGRRCVTGTVVRLAAVAATGGVAAYPGPADPSISVRGALPQSGGRRTYQVWYRNAAAFCTTSTFNLTNGLIVQWAP
jgi:hypothetical protein